MNESEFEELVIAADSGDADAELALAEIYMRGPMGLRNLTKAVSLYTKLAHRGHPVAQNQLGLIHEQGLVSNPNLLKAAEYFRAAADGGCDDARYNLARLILAGVDKDIKEALGLLEKAGEEHAEAQFLLGQLHDSGKLSLGKNQPRARLHYERAATQGHKGAKESLAVGPTA